MAEIKAPEGGRPVSEMQERIARAIEAASKDCDDPDVYYQVAPLAAMKAMREPTPEMIGSGGLAMLKSDLVTGRNPLAGVIAAYTAMLDTEISIAEGGKDGN